MNISACSSHISLWNNWVNRDLCRNVLNTERRNTSSNMIIAVHPAGKLLLGIRDTECGSIEPVSDSTGRACKPHPQTVLASEHLQHCVGSSHPPIQAPGGQHAHVMSWLLVFDKCVMQILD